MAPKSREILMFVCLEKDAKQCCDATKLDYTHCAGRRPQVGDQRNEHSRTLWRHSIVWRLFGDKQTSKSRETYNQVTNELQNSEILSGPLVVIS